MNTNARVQSVIRIAQVVTGLLFLVVAAAFYFRWPMVADVWPWTGYNSSLSNLSYIFISSVLAAFAAPLLWMGLAGEVRAAIPITIDVIIVLLGTGLFTLQDYAQNNSGPTVLRAGIIMLVSVPLAVVVLWASRKFPLKNKTMLSPVLRFIFGFVCIALLISGYELLTKSPTIFPWPLSAETSVVYGWAFWGALGYFLYGLLQPYWVYAAGPLLGLLVYDLVLIFPYIAHLNAVTPDHRTSLIIFMAFIIFSGIVAIYYCFINQQTRIWRRPSVGAPEVFLAGQG